MRKTNSFPLGKSYLHFNFQCLSWLGIWNPYEGGLKYWLYQVYWVYVISVIMAMRLMNILVRGINAENSAQFLQEFSMLAVETADTIKYIAFLFHRAEVLELSEAFNWERHLLGTNEITQYRNTVLTSSLSSSKTFTITIMITLIQYFTFSFYSAFCEADYKAERLPISVAPMKYCFVLTNFWVAFISDYLTFTLLGLIAVAHDAFIMAVMINVEAQLKILNFRLERCHLTNHHNHDATRNDVDPVVIHFECVERCTQNALNLNAELINCIKFHQQIVRILRIFKKIYDNALLPQLFISLLLITALLLQMILGRESNNTDAVVALGFLIPVILQLLTFCWGGNIILVESDRSSNSLYVSHWYTRDREFRDNVKIFLGAIRNPLIVRAGGLCDLSAVTFKNIISKAYSGVAVLQNMQNE
ncbi:odorant receptor 33b [Diachasma alloeum]|uniref:Odorant receptor n=1 Tax=Diachasma alloeum TaxID=454923 RepID=A0A4E0RJQ4_9HYME|nr:odorant receptor 33b [Diachasma alloeum]THK32982.1 odorant receptor 114 [Diachasma alloeum]